MSLFDDLLIKAQGSTSQTNDSLHGDAQKISLPTKDEPITIGKSMSIATEATAPNPVEPPNRIVTEPSLIIPVETENDSIIIDSSSISTINGETLQEVPEDHAQAPEINITMPMESLQEENDNMPLFDSAINTTSPLFDMIKIPENIPGMEIHQDDIAEPLETTPFHTVEKNNTPFHDTAEFIGHTIGGIGMLITNIDAANDAKIAERDGYKAQKEHFAELELQAEGEHQKMLIERAHAKKMETYLKHEKEKTTPAANDEQFTQAA